VYKDILNLPSFFILLTFDFEQLKLNYNFKNGSVEPILKNFIEDILKKFEQYNFQISYEIKNEFTYVKNIEFPDELKINEDHYSFAFNFLVTGISRIIRLINQIIDDCAVLEKNLKHSKNLTLNNAFVPEIIKENTIFNVNSFLKKKFIFNYPTIVFKWANLTQRIEKYKENYGIQFKDTNGYYFNLYMLTLLGPTIIIENNNNIMQILNQSLLFTSNIKNKQIYHKFLKNLNNSIETNFEYFKDYSMGEDE
jgi:hypothetical protein